MNSQSDHLSSIAPAAVRYTTLTALAVAVLVAFMPPVLNFYFAYQHLQGHEEEEAKQIARRITELVSANPSMWEYETLSLEALARADDDDERIIVRNTWGETLTAMGALDLPQPFTSSSAPVYASGVVVGEVSVSLSLRETLQVSLLIFVLSGALATGSFLALKTLPLRLLKQATDRASFLASHDPLTGLPNRSLFNEILLRSLDDVSRTDGTLAVLCLDLDHFKEVNDILGHAKGDMLLRLVSERMTNILRRNDTLARLGGDEFTIIQMHSEQPEGATRLAERLIEAISVPFDLDGNEVHIGVSIGITFHDKDDPEDIEGQTLLRQADLALYKAKTDGRGIFRFFEESMNEKLIARKRMEADLRKAISRNELTIIYQPQIDLQSNEISGVEALVQWLHREKGPIGPQEFMNVAEETGLIVSIGEWVIREVCRNAKKWPGLSFAVNVSPIQFRQGNLVETVRDALRDSGADPQHLELEITETVLFNHTDETISILKALQGMGVRIVMDEFGTGYSSLGYLRRFPFNKIKIDRSFINDLGTRGDADSIIDAVIGIGASMGMTSNAEGVETAEQAELLRKHGCNEVQGFFFSKPLPSEEIGNLLAEWERSKRGSQGEIPVEKAGEHTQSA